LQPKAYTKGEHVLRCEATVHNTKQLRCRRSLDNFDQIIDRPAGMADRHRPEQAAEPGGAGRPARPGPPPRAGSPSPSTLNASS
jgi:hypothetical protein